LCVVGETVDGRVCETLEEIFRRVRFRCIDLEATSLDEEVGYNFWLSPFFCLYIQYLLAKCFMWFCNW